MRTEERSGNDWFLVGYATIIQLEPIDIDAVAQLSIKCRRRVLTYSDSMITLRASQNLANEKNLKL